jgi:flagellar protein FliT
MHMQSRKQAFATLTDKLRGALEATDWEAVTILDLECRALVAALRDEDASDAGLHEQLVQLSRLYDCLQQSGNAERSRVAGELTRLNQSRQVNQAYKALD